MRFILSLAALLLVSWPAFGHGYGVPQQFIPRAPKQFAPPVQYVPVPRTVVDYVPIQQQPPAYCPPAAAFAPSYGVQASFGAGKSRGFLPGRGLFGGGRQSTFRQRTFFRGQGGGVQAQFGAY